MSKAKWYAGLMVAIGLVLVVGYGWLRLGPDSWEVQITGVTGDGNNVQYRIETVYAGTSDTLIFRNEDARFWPPYLKPDSADVQSDASRISRNCPEVPVVIHGYDVRFSWFSMFPNVTRIEAPDRCLRAPDAAS